MSDEELAVASQSGDLASFEELVRRYENRIYAFVYQCCGNDADAREVTQDTFVRAFEAIGKFDAKRAFGPWLFAIARRKGIDSFRAKIPGDGEKMPERIDASDPAELAARREEARDLWQRASTKLPGSQFQSLWLRYAEEMDIGEIASVMGKSRTHIKVLLFRARQTLAEELKPALPPGILAAKGASV